MHKAALIVIDYINDIAHLKGKIARSAERIEKHQAIEHANEAIRCAREKHFVLIFVKVGFHPGYPDCPKHSLLFWTRSAARSIALGIVGNRIS